MQVQRGRRLAAVMLAALTLAGALGAQAGEPTRDKAGDPTGQKAANVAGEKTSERIALPFICTVEGGRIRLMPSKERIHAILGQRHEQTVMVCAASGNTDCQTLVAHRFAMACGGRRVQWADVALAIGGRRNSRVWSEAGQLNVAIMQASASQFASCSGPGNSSPGNAANSVQGMVQEIAARPCMAERPRETRFTMPTGFAPVAHFGGRILVPSALDTRPTVDFVTDRPQKVVIAAAPAATASDTPSATRRLLERTVITQPLPDIVAGPSPAEPVVAKPNVPVAAPSASGEPVTQLAWGASVRPALVEAFAASDVGSHTVSARDGMLWLMLTVGLVSFGWVAWSRPAGLEPITKFARIAPQLSTLRGMIAGRFDRIAWPSLAAGNLGSGRTREDAGTFPSDAIDAQLVRVEGMVGLVDPALPLRHVLDEETRRVRQRLAVAKSASAYDAGDRGRLPAAAYRVLMRDLERILRIAESAKESISGSKQGTAAGVRIPATRAEAFDVLGINDSVGEATVKKVVDALRMSWHPDLAQDDADRETREERIKQINVAMELIVGKRLPA